MVGFFLISKKGGSSRSPINFETLSRHGRHVFVKGRYSGIVMAAYPQLQVEPVEDVEEAVMNGEKGSVGLEIVQSGNTLKSKGLCCTAHPCFYPKVFTWLIMTVFSKIKRSESLWRH